VVGTLLLAGALPVQAQTSGNTNPQKTIPQAKTAAQPSPAEVKARASYSLGVSFGTQLHGYGVGTSSLAYDRVVQGIKDALAGKTAGPEDEQRVQSLIAQARQVTDVANKAAAKTFLAANGKLPGIVTTPTGLQYKIVRQGTGEPPKPTDGAVVNYRGTLLDGTEFDSSYKRHEPASLTVDQVIKGWQEALVLMKPGSKFELYIPPELAYGDNPPQGIPPGALLKFEVELLSVKPATSAAPAPGGAMTGPKHP
jgi:FKBP-type peptidyl-prolyl cis-trans isomerase